MSARIDLLHQLPTQRLKAWVLDRSRPGWRGQSPMREGLEARRRAQAVREDVEMAPLSAATQAALAGVMLTLFGAIALLSWTLAPIAAALLDVGPRVGFAFFFVPAAVVLVAGIPALVAAFRAE